MVDIAGFEAVGIYMKLEYMCSGVLIDIQKQSLVKRSYDMKIMCHCF